MKFKLLAQSVTVIFVATLAAMPGMSQTTFFSDNFSNGSTVDSFTPTAPTTDSTSYEYITSKGWNPTPSLTSNSLLYGINSTSSGTGEMQALFSAQPIPLTANGDYITMVIVYTNVAGLLTSGEGFMGFGLYNSGASTNYPVPGGLNSNATTSTTTNSMGNAALWQGYFSQVAYTGNNDAIQTRPVQTTGASDAAQDLITTGSGSESFQYPKGAEVGSSLLSSLVLNSNTAVYTEVLTIAVNGTSSLAITNSFYQGAGTNGTMLVQFGGIATNTTFLTGGFNALAIGWNQKTTAPGTANVVDLASIDIFGQSTAVSGPPSISSEPSSVIVATNSYAQFAVGASGFDVSYQWYLNGAPLANAGTYSGAKTSTLVISPTVATNAAASADGYYCIVTGAGDYSTNTVTNSLTLVEATNLVWVGTEAGGNWDVDTTADWETTNSPASAAVFTGGDPVSFNDASALNGNVTLAGNVGPSSISVTTANAFDFGGTGSIVGPGYAVFDGENAPGEVELNVNNTYTGGTLFTNGIYVYLENYNGLGDGPVILGSSSAEMEIVNAGGATTGVNGNIDIVSNCEFLIDGTGTYAGVFFGNLSGSSSATLTFEPSSAGIPEGNGSSTNRMRLYGTSTVCNANIFIDGPSTPEAQYNGDEIAPYNATGTQVYNGVISGNGGVIQRGTGTTILNGQNTFAGGTTPTTGAIGVGASSIGTPGNVISGPLGTGVLLLAPEVPSITGSAMIEASAPNVTIGNTIEYPSGTNNLTLEVGGTNSLTFSGPFGLNGADGLITNTITNRIVDVTNTALTTFSG